MKKVLLGLFFALFIVTVLPVFAESAPQVIVDINAVGEDDDCGYHIEYVITGLTANARVYADETSNEVDCEGNVHNTSWQDWEVGRTNAHGEITLVVEHNGFGDYAVAFTDSYGQRARVLFSYRQEGALQYQIPFSNAPFFFGALEPGNETQQWAEVLSDYLPIRSGRTDASQVIGYAVRGNLYPVLVVRADGWLRLDSPQGTGWVHQELYSGPTATAVPPVESAACANLLPARLEVGLRGMVVFDPPHNNRVRSSASLDAPVRFSMVPGTQFEVTDGPTCADNFRWWKIETDDGQTGWTADGNADEYWLEPVSHSSSDSRFLWGG